MSDAPVVTVIIPTYNRADLLMETIGSVAAQTFPRWEIIVVDDGSTDDTLMRLMAMADPRIRVIGGEHIGHLGRLRNMGAQMSRGEYLAFVDSDDLWLPEKLERQLRAVAASGAEWSYTSYTLFDDTGADIPLRAGSAKAISGNIIANLLRDETGVWVSSLLVSRSLYFSIGGFSESELIPFRGDIDIALRLARRAEVIALPQTLLRGREHSGRMTVDIRDANEHTATVYRLFLEQESDPVLARLARRRLGQCLADAGGRQLAHGNIGPAIASFRKSLAEGGVQLHQLRAAARGLRQLVKIGIPLTPHGQGMAPR